MGSKAFLLLGLLLAIGLLISSAVAARHLAEASSDQKKVASGVDVAKYGGYGGYPGGGYGGYPEGRYLGVPSPRTGGYVKIPSTYFPPTLLTPRTQVDFGGTGPYPKCTRCCSYA